MMTNDIPALNAPTLTLPTLDAMTLSAPAKINWLLSVTGRRPDGFHEVLTVMQSVSLCDTLVFETAGALELVSEMDVPVEENLVMRAAKLLQAKTGTTFGARIRLAKNIPEQAGLGGGSSDAAATLLGLDKLWRLGLSMPELLRLASMLGSDVPFFVGGATPCVNGGATPRVNGGATPRVNAPCVIGGMALAEGRGEVVTPLDTAPARSLVIVKPPFGIPTAWAYGRIKEYSKRPPDAMGLARELAAALGRLDFETLRRLMKNDLQTAIAADTPRIARIESELLNAGAGAALMSGSGSAVFGVFADAAASTRARARLRAALPDCRVECVETVSAVIPSCVHKNNLW